VFAWTVRANPDGSRAAYSVKRAPSPLQPAHWCVHALKMQHCLPSASCRVCGVARRIRGVNGLMRSLLSAAGRIPTELGALVDLTHMYLASNKLTGTCDVCAIRSSQSWDTRINVAFLWTVVLPPLRTACLTAVGACTFYCRTHPNGIRTTQQPRNA